LAKGFGDVRNGKAAAFPHALLLPLAIQSDLILVSHEHDIGVSPQIWAIAELVQNDIRRAKKEIRLRVIDDECTIRRLEALCALILLYIVYR
jgi:hypothetical protein